MLLELCDPLHILFGCAAANDVTTMEKLVDSLQFDLATIEAATKKFSEDNKLGTGGFGEVYKVRLISILFIFVLKNIMNLNIAN